MKGCQLAACPFTAATPRAIQIPAAYYAKMTSAPESGSAGEMQRSLAGDEWQDMPLAPIASTSASIIPPPPAAPSANNGGAFDNGPGSSSMGAAADAASFDADTMLQQLREERRAGAAPSEFVLAVRKQRDTSDGSTSCDICRKLHVKVSLCWLQRICTPNV